MRLVDPGRGWRLLPRGQVHASQPDWWLLEDGWARQAGSARGVERLAVAAPRLPAPPPVCSVVIPVAPADPAPDRCVHALLNDTARVDIEILVVTCDTRLASRWPNPVGVVHSASASTPAAACNLGARFARGDYLAFLDADTEMQPGALRRLLLALQARPTAGVAGRAAAGGGAGGGHGFRVVPAVHRCGLVVARRLFAAVGGFDPSLETLDGADLCLKLRARGREILAEDGATPRAEPGPDAEERAQVATRWPGAFPAQDPTATGVRWSGSVFTRRGAGEDARSTVVALTRAGIAVRIEDDPGPDSGWLPDALRTVLHLRATDALPERFVHVTAGPPPLFRRDPRAALSVGRASWPFDRLPPAWADHCNAVDEVWVPSRYHVETFTAAGVDRSRIAVVPHGLATHLYDPSVAPLRLPDASFTFLSAMEWTRRNGWDVMVRAYLEEFTRAEGTQLVINVTPRPGATVADHRDELHRFVHAIGHRPEQGPRITLIDADLDIAEMPRLYRAADAFVRASRADSWGRAHLEAMAMGLPTIGTRWGAQLEFMSDDNSFLIDCELVDVPRSAHIEEPASYGRWAQPSVDHLRTLMRRVAEDDAAAASRGRRGRADVLRRHSLAAVAEAVRTRIDAAAATATPAASEAIARRPHPTADGPSPRPGTPLVWSAEVFAGNDVADEARTLVAALDRAGARVAVVPDDVGDLTPLDPSLLARLRRLAVAEFPERSAHVAHVPLASAAFRPQPAAARNVGRAVYPADGLPPYLVAACNEFDEVWVASEAARDSFARCGVHPDKVVTVPPAVDTDRYRPGLPPLPLPERRGFVFLSVLDAGPGAGWEVLLRAYLEEFTRADDVTLVFRADRAPRRLTDELRRYVERELRRDLATGPHVAFVGRFLDPDAAARLYAAADAFVLSSSGDRLARRAMEAMASGVPTIASGCGAYADFASGDDGGYLIDCEPVGVDVRWREAHAAGLRWMHPSWQHLRALLREVVEQRGDAAVRAARGRERVVEGSGADVVAVAVAERLGGGHAIRTQPPRVRWEGPHSGRDTIAVINRALSTALEARGVEVSRVGGGAPTGARLGVPTVDRRLTDADVSVSHHAIADSSAGGSRRVVMHGWHGGTLPTAWPGRLNRDVDEVWVPTSACRDALLRDGVEAGKVVVVPPGVDSRRWHAGVRPAALPTDKTFRFLFAGPPVLRAGADIALETYLRTFRADDDACLVFASTPLAALDQPSELHERIRAAAADPRLPEIVTVDCPADVPPELYTACSSLVSPHRAEAYCLHITHAMACGLPVVVPDAGACLDMCNPSVAYLVPAAQVRLPDRRVGPYPTAGVPRLHEVDRDALAATLREVFEQPAEARRRGRRAAEKVHSEFSLGQVAGRMEERLRALVVDGERHRAASPPRSFRYPPLLPAAPQPQPPADGRRRELTVCLVVKDEERGIGACLGSVDGLADEIVVIDTGSTDRTVEIARSFGAEVFHERWVDDFAVVRNAYLARATKDWILVLDGDNVLDPGSHREVRRLVEQDALIGYAPRQMSAAADADVILEHRDVRLFPNHPELTYVGRIHSQLIPTRPDLPFAVAPCDVVIHHSGYHTDAGDRRPAWERYARIIEEEVRGAPADPYHAYNLGVVYHQLGRHAEAEQQLRTAVRLCEPHLAAGFAPAFLGHAHLMLALALLALGHVEDAAATCNDLLRLTPTNADAHCTLAVALARLGRFDDALASYQRAAACADSPTLWPTDRAAGTWKAELGMSEIHALNGRWEEASACLERADAAAPGNPAVAAALTALRRRRLPGP